MILALTQKVLGLSFQLARKIMETIGGGGGG